MPYPQIPVVKMSHKLCIDNALRKQRLIDIPYKNFIEKSKIESSVEYAIAGFAVKLVFYRYHGEIESNDHETMLTKPFFIVTWIDEIALSSILEDGDIVDLHDRVARHMASHAYIYIPATFTIIDSLIQYVIQNMEFVETKNPLIAINNPLKNIEIFNIGGKKLDISWLQEEIKKQESELMIQSPFFTQKKIKGEFYQKLVMEQ